MQTSHSAENDTVKQRVASKAIVSMNTTSNFTSRIQARDSLSSSTHARRVHVDLETTHAVMDDWCDNSYIERLGLHIRPLNDVVKEFLARTSLATRLVPRLAARICWPRATV